MRIAIAGGTGTLGSLVAAELDRRGHEIRVLSRSAPEYRVDLATGNGLADALAGCDVVVDASNNSSRRAADVLVAGTRRLLEAEHAAGVRHHVCISIVGCGLAPVGYYRVKAEQEQVATQGPVPCSVVRATQFHELVLAALTAGGRWRVLPVPRARVQPVACAEVAGVVAGVATGAPGKERIQVAGPQVTEARDLARTWRSVTGRRTALIPVPLPGRLGRALRGGALTEERPDVRGTVTFADWLAARR
jgi:uncharacterized protein YbjT (DUF2867 family)